MNRATYNQLLTIAFVGCVLFVAGFVAVTYNSLKKTTRISSENQTTLVVLKNLEIAQTNIVAFDNACRHYLLTGDTAYYNLATSYAEKYYSYITTIDVATVTNPTEKSDLLQYKKMAADKINEGLAAIAYYNRNGTALNIATEKTLSHATDSLWPVVERIETAERINLAMYDTQKLQSANRAFMLVMGFATIAIICFTGFSIAIKKNIDKRVLAEYKLRNYNTELETRVQERTRELAESEKKYRMLFYNNPLPMFMLSLPGFDITDVNDAAISHYGYTRDEFLRMNARDLRPASEVDRFNTTIGPLTIKGTNHMGQWKHVKKNGDVRNVEIVAHDINNKQGQQRLILAIDVTEREQAMHDLKRYNKELADYKFALDESAIVAITNADGIITYANDNFCRTAKYSREELIGNTHRIINSGYHSKAFIKNMWQTIKAGKLWRDEIRNKAKDGTLYWSYTTIVPFLDNEGKPYQYLSIRHDITERKKAEKELIRSESSLREAQSVAHIGSWDFDMVNNIHTWSDELFSILGYKKGEVDAGLDLFLSRIHPDDAEQTSHTIINNLANGVNSSVNFRFVRKDGEMRYGYSEAKFEFDSHLKPVRAYGILQDVTDLKKAEEEIKQLNESLELRIAARTAELTEANKALEAFSYSVSHDLRAPVRSVLGFCRLITDQHGNQLDEDVKELLAHIQSSGTRMNAIIDDMLMLAKYERLKIKTARVDMNKLVRNIWDDILFASAHHAKLQLDTLPVVNGDESMLQQVWVDLLSNAIKYSGKKEHPVIKIGGIINGGHATFFVRDNGAGFDMQHYNKLFNAFHRLHGYSEFEGTGVGLVLVKKIIEKHGGRVWAEGAVNEGATFYFTLPTSQPVALGIG